MRTITGYKAGGITTVGNSDRANEFKTFFNCFDSSATPALPLPAPAPSGPMHCPHQLPNTVSSSTTFTTEKVRQELWRLRPGKAAGPDRLCTNLLKACANELAEPVVRIYNQSLHLGKVPSLWKTSCIVPVPKKGRPSGDDPCDYRPMADFWRTRLLEDQTSGGPDFWRTRLLEDQTSGGPDFWRARLLEDQTSGGLIWPSPTVWNLSCGRRSQSEPLSSLIDVDIYKTPETTCPFKARRPQQQGDLLGEKAAQVCVETASDGSVQSRLRRKRTCGDWSISKELPDPQVCKFFWGQIEAALPHMVHITPAQDVLHAVTTSLQPIDEFFLFMNDLSLDLVQKDLAHRFKVHQSTVNPIIDTRANCLYEVLGTIGIWFDEDTLKGSISDREILKQSGLVSLLKPSRAIMVDKGFLLEDLVPYKVYIPAFLHKKSQLSGAEVRKTQSTARLRVHKKGEGTQISLSLTGSINQLSAVVCLLVNYQNGPVVKAWARTVSG
ncbi:hypothetical protein WMY93_033478 [Mugilogobius chulae]|uniref:DDE Tnp4 domain-containing protein n=1 Tax=Mugilogobius chulae TaxID=88201 RepID=A0AAW0MSR7_9GOBI